MEDLNPRRGPMLRSTHFALPLAAALTLVPANFGGWAVVTLDDLPDAITVAQPVTFTYTVRQHGRTLLSDLRGYLEAESGRDRIRVAAAPSGEPGRYRATLTLPRAGNWTITVFSGFGNSNVTLLPVPAVTSARTASAATQSERGRRLFVAKGCLTCHAHDEVPGSGTVAVGPPLSGRRYAAAYLSRFLADPSIAAVRGPNGLAMPNLNLRGTEISALVAFINGGALVGAEE
jgi:mono/diheme cytochrome c family protein